MIAKPKTIVTAIEMAATPPRDIPLLLEDEIPLLLEDEEDAETGWVKLYLKSNSIPSGLRGSIIIHNPSVFFTQTCTVNLPVRSKHG